MHSHISPPTISSRSVLPALLLVLAITGCGGDDDPSSDDVSSTTTTAPASGGTTTTTAAEEIPLETPDQAPTDLAGFRQQPVACGGDTPPEPADLTFEAPEDMGIDPASTPNATLATSCGPIVVALDPASAPEAVNSFVFLAEEGYFDGTVSHRVAPGFVVQAGDPTATGRGGPGYALPDELPPDDFLYTRGTVAMANSGPDSAGSQFFIMLADGALPPDYTVFGTVVEGMESADAIAAVPLGANPLSGEMSVPLETVYIEEVTVDQR